MFKKKVIMELLETSIDALWSGNLCRARPSSVSRGRQVPLPEVALREVQEGRQWHHALTHPPAFHARAPPAGDSQPPQTEQGLELHAGRSPSLGAGRADLGGIWGRPWAN